jgi:hypothetical protein
MKRRSYDQAASVTIRTLPREQAPSLLTLLWRWMRIGRRGHAVLMELTARMIADRGNRSPG